MEDLWAAWEACPKGCMPLVLGDLNINFSKPQDKRDEVSMRQEDTHLGNLADNQPERGGPGGRRGRGSCITRSRIMLWCVNGTPGDFGM